MRMINKIISDDASLGFSKITQEENVGVKGKAKFADGIDCEVKQPGHRFFATKGLDQQLVLAEGRRQRHQASGLRRHRCLRPSLSFGAEECLTSPLRIWRVREYTP